MRRRTFIALLGGSATAPLLQRAALAEGKTVTIGVLVTGHPSIDIVMRGLRDALAKIGWIEGTCGWCHAAAKATFSRSWLPSWCG